MTTRTSRKIAAALIAALMGTAAPIARPALADQATAPSASLGLKTRSVVEGPVVRLSDLFEGLDAAKDKVVDQAPQPGATRTYSSGTLARLAKQHALGWEPVTFLDKVVVERDSVAVQVAEIIAAARVHLLALGLPKDVEIDLFNRGVRLFRAAGEDSRIEVEDLFYDPGPRRFDARVRVVGESGRGETLRIAGAVHYVVSVPMLRRTVSTGDTIQAKDLVWKKVRQSNIGGPVLLNGDQIVGRLARRPLPPEQMLRETDLKDELLVQRNTMVTVVLQQGRMTLTAQAKALGDGASGAVVRVMNLKTNRVLDVVVVGPNQVAVGGHTTIAQN